MTQAAPSITTQTAAPSPPASQAAPATQAPAPTIDPKAARKEAAAEYLPKKNGKQYEPKKVEPAPEEKTAEAPTEEAKTESPEPKPEPVAKAFISLKRQKHILAEKERILQRREQALAQAQREHHELRELAQKDPWEFAHKMGFNARDVAKRAVDQSAETPEAKALKEISEQNKQLQAEIKELREGFTNRTQAEREAADVAAIQSVIGEHDCPFLQDEPIEEVTQAFKTVFARDYEPAGLPLNRETAKEIFEFMEGNLRAIYEGKLQRVQKARGVSQGAPSERGNGAVAAAKPAKPDVTLSNIEAAEVASAPAGLSITDPKAKAARLERAIAKIRYKESG